MEKTINNTRAVLSIIISVIILLGIIGGLYVKVYAVDSLKVHVDTLETRVYAIEKTQIKIQKDIEYIKENSEKSTELTKEILKLLRDK